MTSPAWPLVLLLVGGVFLLPLCYALRQKRWVVAALLVLWPGLVFYWKLEPAFSGIALLVVVILDMWATKAAFKNSRDANRTDDVSEELSYMNSYPHPLIAKEGWPFIAGSLVLAVLVTWFSAALAVPFWIVFVFCVQFFRDPGREIAGNGPKSIVAPADGRIVVVEETNDPYLNRKALKVSVFMNVFNVHSNRAPIDSTVLQKWYNPGSFVNAALDKASIENERCALHLKTQDGRDVTCVQIAGLVARRILNYVDAGKVLARGDRYGFIRFCSRVDLYLPLDSKVKVVIGEKVYASTTLLAELS